MRVDLVTAIAAGVVGFVVGVFAGDGRNRRRQRRRGLELPPRRPN